ncbi:phosphorylase kinase gamma subunit-like [Tropilaelaps mercedesae]|uniref:phosphorylase kinase n=1 Tax=Tropilaelaps mercedesae TaxID=418985 RepID=A0A1V9Y2A7_9ACAR|nr:phosphorylase kinase gamma subunit-like [Tropilaelaps mercedesae]
MVGKHMQDDELPGKDVAKEFYARYEPKEILGRGVSSTVRRCVEKNTGREFAAKIIDVSSPDAINESSFLAATRREIAILRRAAGHSHIIELHDVFESTTFIFLVLELCPHGELFDYLTSLVTLSEKKTRHIMRQLLDAVAFIHDNGVVHRDIKPENILLDDKFNVKITDFGFATELPDGVERLHELCGTPGYLAPELLKASMYEGEAGYGREVDVWACGVVMYTLLVGFPPFWHRKQMVMLRAIMEGRYEFKSPEWDDVTDTAKDLIHAMLTVDPKKRITARQALQHQFFGGVSGEYRRVFNPQRVFHLACLTVRAMVRIRRFKFTPEMITADVVTREPYRIRTLRKAVDACAFRVYNHWVKRGEVQNRAALFENRPKCDLLSIIANSHDGSKENMPGCRQ